MAIGYLVSIRLPNALRLVSALAMSLALCACASRTSSEDLTDHPGSKVGSDACQGQPAGLSVSPPDDKNYRIQAGDLLSLDFYLSPEFNDDLTVAPDGNITLRLVGQVRAAGLTPAQLAKDVDWAYSSELKSPDVVVHVKNMPGRQVFVEGQVVHPGAFPLAPGMTALQGIAQAGGLTQDAGEENAVLIRRDGCGSPHGMRINLARAADHPGEGEDVELLAYDVVVVPRSRIANMDLWVDHYIRRLMPMQQYMSMPTLIP